MSTQEIYDDVLARAERLPVDQIKRLIGDLNARLEQCSEKEPEQTAIYSVLDFEGIGHGTWDEVGGVDAFLEQERASWDS